MQNIIRDWIVAQLNTVPNIGIVHSYQRYAAREKDLADLYHSNGRLHGWFVRRVSVVEKQLAAGINTERSTWLVRGYLAINDAEATEIEFDDLLESMRTVFRTDAFNVWQDINTTITVNLVYTDQPTTEQLGLAVLESQPVLFAGVLCHSAECQLIVNRCVTV